MSNKSLEVCIIGGGISGLKAAEHLLKNSCFTQDDLIVLEAQDYIGGRLRTDRTSSKFGNPYDLGGSWFHDCLSNVLFQHFYGGKDLQVFDWSKDGYFDDKPIKVYSHKGEVDLAKSNKSVIVHDIEKFIELYFFEHLDPNDDISLKEIVDLYISKYDKLLTKEQKEIAKVSMRYLELWHGVSWEKLSAKYAVLDHQGRNFYNKKGNDTLISWLMESIPSQVVQTNSPVVKIERNLPTAKSNANSGKKLAVHTKNSQIIYCNYIIVCVPQSILSLNANDQYGIEWDPPLPTKMQQAIQKIHFGALGKVVFEFDSIWWDMDYDRFEIVSDDTLKTTPQPDMDHQLEKLPPPFTYPTLAINYSVMQTHPKGGSLILLTQSPLTEYLEKNPSQAWEYFKPMLSTIAIQKMCEPINVITTNWTLNPYIRGSYAAAFPKDDPVEYFTAISGDIPNVGLSDSTIRFAGEHTATEGEGCFHGAWMSGQREANWIIQHSGKSAKL